ncbi:MAG: response regulator [Phycisphaeraceae bacterium]|nr:response regulator [Phycisphaeraceae bacterium]
MSSEPLIRVLLVEDNPGDARLIAESLRDAHPAFTLRTVDRLSEIRPALAAHPCDILLLDLGLPDAQGLDSFRAVQSLAPGLPIIVLSGLSDQDIAIRAVREGAQDYLVKGRFDGDTLPRVVRFAVERRRADEALRRSEARFRAAIEASPDAFAVLEAVRDASGRIWSFTLTDMNTRAEQLLGAPLSQLAGKPLDQWCPFGNSHDSIATFSRVVETRESIEQEIATESAAGTTFTLRRVYPLADGVAVFVRDITARKRLEDQLRQTQKMEALGQLAAGIAHDFRNLIAAMQGHIANARALLTPDHPALQHLEHLQSAATQASGIAGSLLRYSARTTAEKKPVRLAAVIDQAVGILRASLPASISVHTSTPDPFIFVHADPSQLQQVVMNLALNARDAMPRGGTLSISLDRIPSSSCPDGLAQLVVKDTGVGMAEDTRTKIFEPYFTTKPRGQGTGLGLSITHGIITEHGGSIAVDSKSGQGSTFTILLPAIPAPARPEAPRHAQASVNGAANPAAPSPSRHPSSSPSQPSPSPRTALLIDPNPFIREVVASMLASMHFVVLQAADIATATRLATSADRRLDLIIAASHLPDGSGEDSILQIRRSTENHSIRGIVITTSPVDAPRAENTGALPHPFRRADLAREVDRLHP